MIHLSLTATAFALLVGHALADYPLQGDFVARAKNPHDPSFANAPRFTWQIVLTMHALIHGGMVALVTGSLGLGLAEMAAHWAIDHMKNEGKLSFMEDQALHLVCKAWWLCCLYVASVT